MTTVSSRTLEIAHDWKSTDYYDKAESDAWTDPFWKPGTPFRRLFERLDTTSTVELACGHGRHSARFLSTKRDQSTLRSLVLMDVVEENVRHCKKRFSVVPEVSAHTNSGYDFHPVEDGSVSAIFCFDAMVHFEYDAVFSYLQDASRILRQGGRALFHHSNLDTYPGSDYRNNPHWRNFMSRTLFAHAASRSGLRVLEQVTIDWDEARNLDCLTLVEKASDGSPGMEKPRARSGSSRLTRLADRVRFIFLK
ncbi:class I SAM-dependent methyltransferase [Bradyrhizobium sp. 146]|uniref:class I SAM-dependent methyltransferase n=1 Tax=unclassified Bradyrhizobium TaxID=2631580 RepID=UPI00036A7B5F|nr:MULTISPECIES: class I SAM-dependent methyltransferase [unclassified Bradyrhizobium]MCK1702647.1 class I SAM-dependent methyltransferase [Bradyrhizobium sp. 146]